MKKLLLLFFVLVTIFSYGQTAVFTVNKKLDKTDDYTLVQNIPLTKMSINFTKNTITCDNSLDKVTSYFKVLSPEYPLVLQLNDCVLYFYYKIGLFTFITPEKTTAFYYEK